MMFFKKFLLILSAALLSQNVLATTNKVGVSTSDYLNMFAGLAFILLLILALAWFYRRLNFLPQSGVQGQLKIVTTLAISPRERLMIVQVGEQQILIASGQNGTRFLHQLEQPLEMAQRKSPDFAQQLAKLINRGGSQSKESDLDS